MATHTFVHFEHEEVAALAELKSIHFDLWSAIQLCEYFESQSQNGYPPSEITDAFSTAILVRYSRAFVSGVRKGLGEDALASLSVGQRANHERLRAFRDKHIAHSVNALEDTKIQARYCEERVQQEGITAVSAAHYRVMGLSSRDVGDVIELSKALLVYVDAKIEEEKKRLLFVLHSMPIAEVLLCPSSPVLAPDHSKIGKRRAIFKK
jgi:hypothetical protein